MFSMPNTSIEVLWLNANICIDKKPIYWQTFIYGGVYFINDILNVRGEFYTFETLISTYGNVCSRLVSEYKKRKKGRAVLQN